MTSGGATSVQPKSGLKTATCLVAISASRFVPPVIINFSPVHLYQISDFYAPFQTFVPEDYRSSETIVGLLGTCNADKCKLYVK